MKGPLSTLNEDQITLLRNAVIEEYDKLFGSETIDPVTWEVLVVIAQK